MEPVIIVPSKIKVESCACQAWWRTVFKKSASLLRGSSLVRESGEERQERAVEVHLIYGTTSPQGGDQEEKREGACRALLPLYRAQTQRLGE